MASQEKLIERLRLIGDVDRAAVEEGEVGNLVRTWASKIYQKKRTHNKRGSIKKATNTGGVK